MASFVVEDGSALPNANAYVTEAEVDEYDDNHNDQASWSGAAQLDKEQAIRNATQYLDTTYAGRWKGRRVDRAQSLDWPRFNVHDEDNFIVDSNVIPKKLKDACAVMALRSIAGEDLLPDLESSGSVIRTRDKVGPLETETGYSSAGIQKTAAGGIRKTYPIIEGLLRGFFFASNRIQRA